MAGVQRLEQVSIDLLKPYERNAKKHPQPQLDVIAKSIQELGFLSPCLIDEDYNLIAGHGRVAAAKQIGLRSVPCVFVEGLTDEQRRAYILADNKLTELGEWDLNIVLSELVDLDALNFDIDLTGFEMPKDETDWFEARDRNDRSRQEGNEEYNEFLEKFEELKTTDDCYTPDNIYDVVAEYAAKRYSIDRERFQRPFYPGGDYQKAALSYKAGDVVVDNPPFSIMTEIVGFYVDRGQKFFLFTPGLTALNYARFDGVTVFCIGVDITYENGAKVGTSFVTNMERSDIVALADPDLYRLVDEANMANERMARRKISKYDYPNEVVTSAKLSFLSGHGQRLEIRRGQSVFIGALDAQKEAGKKIYGGALLLGEKAAAEKAAAEKVVAEKVAAEKWELSDRELEIIKGLGGEA